MIFDFNGSNYGTVPATLARDMISRRGFIGGALATGLLPSRVRAATSTSKPKRLVAGTRMLDVNGRPARVFRLTGPGGRSGLRLAAGERFHVDLVNETGARTFVHWHGQLPPWKQDGFPWPQTPPIAAGAVEPYDYAPIAGTYWMHSHHAMQEQRLLTAPLIVHDAADEREDRQEIVLMLHDFTFRTPDEVLAGLTGTSVADAHALAEKTEGAGTESGTAAKSSRMADMPAMAMPSADKPMQGMQMQDMQMQDMQMQGMRMQATGKPEMGMPGMRMQGMDPKKMDPQKMDLNDVRYDAFLANDRTLADPEIVRVARGGRVRLRIINGASSSQFWIDLGELNGRVVATDGHAAQPISDRVFPIAMAQRLDILIDLPAGGAFPILAQLEGSTQQTGIVLATAGAHIARIPDSTGTTAPALDSSFEARLRAAEPLAARPADAVHTFTLSGGMKPYAWSIGGEYWPQITPLLLSKGQRVEIELVNQSMMAHPMHLHGHVFQVIAIDGQPLAGAMRDTVLVPPMTRVRFAFDADNPGRWAFHCHNLYHMETGMMTEFRYQGIAA